MKENYLKPAIVNADTMEMSTGEGKDGWLPIIVAAASGYAAGKLAKKAISKGINFAFKTPSLTKRRSDYDDICMA